MTKYADRRLCICKHVAADHVGKYPRTTSACIKITNIDEWAKASWCQCQKFKLDTLQYLNQLAQERGQI